MRAFGRASTTLLVVTLASACADDGDRPLADAPAKRDDVVSRAQDHSKVDPAVTKAEVGAPRPGATSGKLEQAFALMREHHLTVTTGAPSTEALERMALSEEDLYSSLTPAQREQVYHYAMSLFASEDRRASGLAGTGLVGYAEAMKRIGIELQDSTRSGEKQFDIEVQRVALEPAPERTIAADEAASAKKEPKCAMCIGFIIGHRRCCKRNVGNGVCVGGPVDCHHYPCGSWMTSDSCPRGGCSPVGCR